MRRFPLAAAATLLLTAVTAFGQNPQELESRLRNKDAAAADEIVGLAETDPKFVADNCGRWLTPLIELQRFDAVEKVTTVAIPLRTAAWPAISDLARARTAALLGLNRPAEALVAARRYYNVCPLAKTDDAVGYLVQALTACGKGDSVKPLVAEQSAAGPATVDLADALTPSTVAPAGVLSSIDVDDAPFKDALAAAADPTTYDEMTGRGNLLLLAGRPGEAKLCFRRAAETTDKGGKALQNALEGVARAIRAEDATPGRANAFVATLRQKP